MTDTHTERDIFKREKKTFTIFEKTYNYEFIPSEHFQDILLAVIKSLSHMHFAATENPEQNYSAIFEVVDSILKTKVYAILQDVLEYQNGEIVSLTELKKRTRPIEIASFSSLLTEDPELFDAVNKYLSSLGKLIGALPIGTISQVASL